MRELLSRDDIHGFLDGMLGAGDRRALYVVAVLTAVGWTEDKQHEGEAVARHLGLNWNQVRASVEDFHRRLGIAPRGGRYRYISPHSLRDPSRSRSLETYSDILASLARRTAIRRMQKDAYENASNRIASKPAGSPIYSRATSLFFALTIS